MRRQPLSRASAARSCADAALTAPAVPLLRRRVLASPDLQLLMHAGHKCRCRSGLRNFECCHWAAWPEQGGVLWPMYHSCPCDNARHVLTNPEGEVSGGQAALGLLLCEMPFR